MRIVVLTGGVGGAKLVPDLRRVLKADDLAAVVNTGDDFRHVSLSVSPDIDTLFYTSAGKANAAQGWGREGETWSFMAALPAGRLDPLSARQLRSDRDKRYRGVFPSLQSLTLVIAMICTLNALLLALCLTWAGEAEGSRPAATT